jgi:hypothetical protein
MQKNLNELLWTTKHVFGQDYFLHMWPTVGVINYKPNKYKQLAKCFLKRSPFPCNHFLQNLKTLKCLIWFGISSTSPNEHVLA